jgi:hypothetical protein
MTDIKTLNLYQRLLEVQKEAKAPRLIPGKFGKARSAEQILEAYKPVCNKYGLFLSTSDEIKEVGGKNYIVATATVVNVELPSEVFSVTANASEGEIPQSKYGADIIDSSQLTGKTSSYAKKYALQNLFAIDDTKDADQDKQPDDSETLARAKKIINESLIAQNYTTPESKKAFINEVLQHATIDNLIEADLVMDSLENEDNFNSSDGERE